MTRRYKPYKLLQLLELDDERLAALHENRLEISTAFEILKMEADDRNVLFHAIISLKLSSSNQRKLVRNCQELAKRKNCKMTTIIKDPEMLKILHDHSLDNSKKTSRLMKSLNRQLYPRLLSAEDEFHKFINKLDLPANTEIKHAPSFEKDSITVSITFENKGALTSKLLNLKEIIR